MNSANSHTTSADGSVPVEALRPSVADWREMGGGTFEAIHSRRSIRKFLPQSVPDGLVRSLLSSASTAPSGSNLQPWRAWVMTGDTLSRVKRVLRDAHNDDEPEAREYQYYPVEWFSPYIERRRAAGWGLFNLAGVKRGDRVASKRQRAENYEFFGAPVGIVFTIDRSLATGSWLDYGMFLQTLMIAARGFGLHTCPQAAIANYPNLLRHELGIPIDDLIVCGMAVGYADPDASVNQLTTSREPVSDFSTFFE